jgi:hypothetical protein
VPSPTLMEVQLGLPWLFWAGLPLSWAPPKIVWLT